jgi:hypothetical protein
MTTKAALGALNSLGEAPWGDLKGKPLDERGLALRLKQYGVKSKTLNMGGDDRAKGYDRTDLHDVRCVGHVRSALLNLQSESIEPERDKAAAAQTFDFMLGPVETAMGANCLNREGSPRPNVTRFFA